MLADGFAAGHPVDTVIKNLWMPEIRSVIELNKVKAARAVDQLALAEALELSWIEPHLMPAYLRGQAYLMAHRGPDAAREFEKILNHRGIVLISPDGALAHLQLGKHMQCKATEQRPASPIRISSHYGKTLTQTFPS
jgi:hypothetical protein